MMKIDAAEERIAEGAVADGAAVLLRMLETRIQLYVQNHGPIYASRECRTEVAWRRPTASVQVASYLEPAARTSREASTPERTLSWGRWASRSPCRLIAAHPCLKAAATDSRSPRPP